jgi:hypothetical protein
MRKERKTGVLLAARNRIQGSSTQAPILRRQKERSGNGSLEKVKGIAPA